MKPLHPAWKHERKIVIGMLHLPPLAGSPLARENAKQIREALLRDARTLARGGVHGLMMENFGDVPFYPDRVPACVIAQMTARGFIVGTALKKGGVATNAVELTRVRLLMRALKEK